MQSTPARSWLVDQAYDALREAILDNEYPPGHQVSAQELAERFGMSRTPVQEAALRLQQEGLVEIVPKRGIRIRALSLEDIAEIYAVIIAVEASAAEIIATQDDAQRAAAADALEAENERMASALKTGDLEARSTADAAFHRLLVERSGNRRFAAIIETVNAQAHRVRRMTAPLRPDLARSLEDHAEIISAIRLGNSAGAHAAARAHRQRACAEQLPLLAKIGLRHF